jgi:hypothetical protein
MMIGYGIPEVIVLFEHLNNTIHMVEMLAGYPPELSESPEPAVEATTEEELTPPERFHRAAAEYQALVTSSDLDPYKLRDITNDMRETVRPYADSFMSVSADPGELQGVADSIDNIGHRIGEIVDGLNPEARNDVGYDLLLTLSHLNNSRFDLRRRAKTIERRKG